MGPFHLKWRFGIIAAVICCILLFLVFISRPPSDHQQPRPTVSPFARNPPPADLQSSPIPDAVPQAGRELPKPKVSREKAKAYLEGLVQKRLPGTLSMPEMNLRPEDNATSEERAVILEFRETTKHSGLALVARATDGSLHFWESKGSPTLPPEFVSPHIRASVTEQDWNEFESRFVIAGLQKDGFGLPRSQKKPNKSPEPTSTRTP